MATEELLNVVDAASYLGIRPWTLRHWISDRKIDVVKYGKWDRAHPSKRA